MALPRRGPLARLVLVALLSVSAGVAWVSPRLGSHCDRHATARTAHHFEPPAVPSWAQGAQHECSHCPPSECSRVAPCATSGSLAVAEVSRRLPDLLPHPVSLTSYIQLHHSTAVQPPTPPPQPIA